MNFSKPSTVGGGGEMSRVTSALPSDASSDAASFRRSSRSVIIDPFSVGIPSRQSRRVAGTGAGVVRCATSRVASETTLLLPSCRRAPKSDADIVSAPNDVVAVRAPNDVVAVGSPNDVVVVGRAPDDVAKGVVRGGYALASRGAPDDVVAVLCGTPDDVVAVGAPTDVVVFGRAPNAVVAVVGPRAPNDVVAVVGAPDDVVAVICRLNE